MWTEPGEEAALEPEGFDDDVPEDAEDEEGAGFDDLSDEDKALILAGQGVSAQAHYDRQKRAVLPQPDRARSAPNLPKVTSSAFRRILK
jgi:hypothetical protein